MRSQIRIFANPKFTQNLPNKNDSATATFKLGSFKVDREIEGVSNEIL